MGYILWAYWVVIIHCQTVMNGSKKQQTIVFDWFTKIEMAEYHSDLNNSVNQLYVMCPRDGC